MTLACIAATEEVWSQLQPAWESTCKERGDPDHIHMTDLWSMHKIYEGWSEEQRDYLVDGLVTTLTAFRDNPWIHLFVCEVDLAAHDRLKEQLNLPSPERLCARVLFPQIMDWFYRPSESLFVDTIDVFFDRGERFMRHIRADWESKKLRKQYPVWNLVRVIEAVNMKRTPPLQMTDFACWGHHRQATYIRPKPWEYDFEGHSAAVRAGSSLRWTRTPIGERELRTRRFLEEGAALVELWQKRSPLVKNPSEEYRGFDRMMRGLLHEDRED